MPLSPNVGTPGIVVKLNYYNDFVKGGNGLLTAGLVTPTRNFFKFLHAAFAH